MAFPVLLDACVLVPMPLVDFLLRLADEGIYRPLWSQDILAETRRTLINKLNKTPEEADKRLKAMRDNFIDAEVTGYQELIGAMRNDEKDRHVLAAAVRERAEVIVTANLPHFPAEAVEPYNIEVRHPDDFLLDQIDLLRGRHPFGPSRDRGRLHEPAIHGPPGPRCAGHPGAEIRR
jgi:predicted nucleic acid-binding protein